MIEQLLSKFKKKRRKGLFKEIMRKKINSVQRTLLEKIQDNRKSLIEITMMSINLSLLKRHSNQSQLSQHRPINLSRSTKGNSKSLVLQCLRTTVNSKVTQDAQNPNHIELKRCRVEAINGLMTDRMLINNS